MSKKMSEVKDHIIEHKYKYGCAILGAAVIVLLTKQKITIINTVMPIFNNSNAVTLGGHLRKIVYCPELDKYFNSVTEAAAYAGVAASDMSRHINGHRPDVKGMVYKIVGVGN